VNFPTQNNEGQFVLAIHDGATEFRLVFLFETNEIQLLLDEMPEPVLSAKLPPKGRRYGLRNRVFDF